ncbi:nitroreductase family protein [Candidatus Hecatella orcuttiae]|uniref:nitroreductase family protein n=1 Tax=Candidatus Hecatella orcuttiae TaxID=1935119 RepID=UPI002867EE05|nr:nitroreductase family protein [Candidatus Hecatella orcuttiae]
MNVLDAIKTRRSIRKYTSEKVDPSLLEKVLEAGRLAPSAHNKQPWHFVVATTPQAVEKVKNAYVGRTEINAPVFIVVCADPKEAWVREVDGEEFWKIDASIAMQNMILAATELGLGTCWIGAFKEKALKRALKIPRRIRIVAITPLGYPAVKKGEVVDRKPLSQIVHYEHW